MEKNTLLHEVVAILRVADIQPRSKEDAPAMLTLAGKNNRKMGLDPDVIICLLSNNKLLLLKENHIMDFRWSKLHGDVYTQAGPDYIIDGTLLAENTAERVKQLPILFRIKENVITKLPTLIADIHGLRYERVGTLRTSGPDTDIPRLKLIWHIIHNIENP